MPARDEMSVMLKCSDLHWGLTEGLSFDSIGLGMNGNVATIFASISGFSIVGLNHRIRLDSIHHDHARSKTGQRVSKTEIKSSSDSETQAVLKCWVYGTIYVCMRARKTAKFIGMSNSIMLTALVTERELNCVHATRAGSRRPTGRSGHCAWRLWRCKGAFGAWN